MKQFVNSYSIKVSYDPEVENPSRIFKSIAGLIDSFKSIDRLLADSIHSSIKIKQVLDDIEKGSIIALIKEFIILDDQTILGEEIGKEKLESYISESRKKIGSILNKNDKITLEDIKKASDEIENIANKNDIKKFITYVKPDELRIAKSLDELYNSIKLLSPSDKAFLEDDYENDIELKSEARIELDEIEEEITENTIENIVHLYLKIKKPDLLGDSAWEFKHNKERIIAKITDEEWLSKFKKGEIPIRPQDSIEVDLLRISNYDRHGNFISKKDTVIKVYDVIHNQ